MTKIICEIINPSDPYTIVGERFDVLAVATLILGNGQWALSGDADVHEMPIFLFGGHEPWLAKHGINDLGAFIDAHLTEIADALDSVLIGSRSERTSIEAVLAAIDDPAQQEKARAVWHDKKRSSMNDIGGRAYALAKRVRERAA